MSRTKLEILHEAFCELDEARPAIERQAALDLANGGIFPIYWNMCSTLVDIGLRSTSEGVAGNTLAMFTEELPSAMRYAGIDAEEAGRDAAATITLLDEMLGKALAAIGDDVYRDMNLDRRRSPEEVLPRPRFPHGPSKG